MPDPTDPLWYKDAVIYQAHVRAFFDSNERRHRRLSRADAEARLPAEPRRQLPLAAAVLSVAAARRRLRHRRLREHPSELRHAATTSSGSSTRRTGAASASSPSSSSTTRRISIPWFQAARRAPAGSPERDFYVWSDTNQKYQGVRIIFTDTETSNWTWDDTAKAYYWHRFFHHQPDLNFDNPARARGGHRGDAVLARSRRRRPAARRRAVPDRARGHDLREPATRRTRSCKQIRARARRALRRTACCSPRRTSGRPTSGRISATATNATWRSTSR